MKYLFVKNNAPLQGNMGFTLVEVMVSIVLGLFVLGTIYSFFISSMVANKVTSRTAEIQETARFAISLISDDIKRAGYFAGNANVADITGSVGISVPTANCLSVGNSWGTMLQQHVFGINNSRAGYICLPWADYLRGDVLTLRYATPWIVNTFTANDLYLRSSLFEGRIFLGSEAANAVNNNIADLPQAVHALVARTYFIGPSGESCDGSAIPALFWVNLVEGVPVIEQLLLGVEHLQLSYGVDSTDDGLPNSYETASSVPDWNDVTAVRLSIIVRDECPDPAFTDEKTYTLGDVVYKPADNLHRLQVDTLVTLRNVLNNSDE
jgi:type IV pilus assembly protein PilW